MMPHEREWQGSYVVLVYVDDLLIAARDEKEGADFLQKVMGIWKIKLTGKISALKHGVLQFLGGTIYLERDVQPVLECETPPHYQKSSELILRDIV